MKTNVSCYCTIRRLVKCIHYMHVCPDFSSNKTIKQFTSKTGGEQGLSVLIKTALTDLKLQLMEFFEIRT